MSTDRGYKYQDYWNLLILQRRRRIMATQLKVFFSFSVHSFLLGLHIYHLFGVLWVGNFILALGECTLAGGFASWYWAYKKPKVGVELSAVSVDTYTHYMHLVTMLATSLPIECSHICTDPIFWESLAVSIPF